MMKKTTTITLFYVAVAVISVAIFALAFYLRAGLTKPELPIVAATGRNEAKQWFPIQQDLEGVNQQGERVKLSDLKGKVWLVAQFFAVCPHCAVRNGAELHALREEFANHPDFHMVCITVDPESDTQERLQEYAKALQADPADWWFLNTGDLAGTHRYLEQELKFFGVRERTDPSDIAANGRYAHDLGFLLVNRNFEVVGKWPLADARSEEARLRDPGLYDRLKGDLLNHIRMELNSPATD
jgi:protein SCO1